MSDSDPLTGTLSKMSEIDQTKGKAGPLAGVKVLELGQAIAGPFAAAFLAWFGAEVIKVEPPGAGDPLRNWRVVHQGTSLWWYSMARNKKCVTLNLRNPEGQRIARDLAKRVDVVLENFRPGTLEKWGLGYEELKKENPGIILARISGYGQTGPNAQKPGFAPLTNSSRQWTCWNRTLSAFGRTSVPCSWPLIIRVMCHQSVRRADQSIRRGVCHQSMRRAMWHQTTV